MPLNNRRWRMIIVVATACAVGLASGLWLGGQTSRRTPKTKVVGKLDDGRLIPPGGLLVNPNSDNPGNPENGVTDLRRIYAAMVAYRSIHNRLPKLNELQNIARPLVPGHQLRADDFKVPDWQLSDEAAYDGGEPRSHYAFPYFMLERPDGSVMPAFPRKGEKDAWVYCPLYTRKHQILFPNGTGKARWSGVYVVLWSDGTIEKVPAAKVLYWQFKPGLRRMEFPGQAGMPGRVMSAKEAHKGLNIDWN